jgi:hypothetical protein
MPSNFGGVACPKPQRGQRVLDKEARDAELLAIERREKAKVKRRDVVCRWPEKHKCRCGIEAAHIQDASLGGPMDAANMILICGFLHRRGPASIHGKQLRVEPETVRGADGPCAFYQQGVDGQMYLVAREIGIREYERD